MTFFDSHHPLAFVGMKPKAPTSKEFSEPCPKCHGMGGWHLQLDAYGPGVHFDTVCDNCGATGFVRNGSNHVHVWVPSPIPANTPKFNCVRYERCVECDAVHLIDSTD